MKFSSRFHGIKEKRDMVDVYNNLIQNELYRTIFRTISILNKK